MQICHGFKEHDDHMRVETSIRCFLRELVSFFCPRELVSFFCPGELVSFVSPRELVSFVSPRKLVSFEQRHVTRSPPISYFRYIEIQLQSEA